MLRRLDRMWMVVSCLCGTGAPAAAQELSARERAELEEILSAAEGTLRLAVSNDGLSPAAGPGTGMGLRMAAFEALGRGGVLEFGSDRRDRWRVRLVVPCG